MTWRYRIVRRIMDGEEVHAIHEYYVGEPFTDRGSITVNPIAPQGETVEELRRDIMYMAAAFAEPVLEYDTFEPDDPANEYTHPTR